MLRVDPSPVLFYFYFFIRSELVRPGLAVRVDPVRLLYLPESGENLEKHGKTGKTLKNTRKQGESGKNIEKHGKTGKTLKNTRKQEESGENREKHGKTGNVENTGKHGESEKNMEKHGKTGRSS